MSATLSMITRHALLVASLAGTLGAHTASTDNLPVPRHLAVDSRSM